MAINSENNSAFIISGSQKLWPDYSIDQHHLEHPTSEFVIDFYQRFQESVNEVLSNVTSQGNVVILEPKANIDPIFLLLHVANKHLKMALTDQTDVDCMALTLADLYEPTAKRTKLIFKVLVNWLLFYEAKTDFVGNYLEKWVDKIGAFEKKKKEKEFCREELAERAENLACLEDKYQRSQMEEEKADLRHKNLQKQKDDRDSYNAKLQRDLQELVGNYQNKDALLTNVKSNVQHLNKQVVTEDSYKSSLDLKEDLVKKCLELESEAENLGSNLENKKPAFEQFYNIYNELVKLNSGCEELNVLQISVSSIKAQLQTSEENYEKAVKKLENLEESKLKHQETTKSVKEVLQSAVLKHNTLKEKMQQDYEQLKIELNKEEELQRNINYDKETLQEKIEKLNNDCEEVTSDIQQLNLSFANTYKNMLDSENSVTNTFSGILKNTKETLHNIAFSGIQHDNTK